MALKKSSKKKLFWFQSRENNTSGSHCSVPRCSASSRYNSFLSFFTFPKDENLQKQWISNIRRDHFKITQNTRVCSRHFLPSDLIEPSNPQRRRLLKKGAVPVLFDWNNFSLPATRTGVLEQRACPDSDVQNRAIGLGYLDHDYALSSKQEALDLALKAAKELRSENEVLRKQIENLAMSNKFGLERFAGSDDDIRFYTRFSSYAHLMFFWSQIEPATLNIECVTREQSISQSFPTSLQPIDEFFLFMTYLSLGLELQDLAHRFKIHPSTVSQIITTWANFLYLVLGAIGIWLDEETVQSNMPEVFSDYNDTHVILHCTELRCQTPDSLELQSEVFSSYKSQYTFKGLIGMAPHGPVTFVSSLYEGSFSDREVLKQSGLVPLLEPTMAIMVDKNFFVEDLVPCKVHMPAFSKKKKKQFSGAELRKNQSIAKLKVHVESMIRNVKEHKLFNAEIPVSVASCINQLFAVACLLVNFKSGPIV